MMEDFEWKLREVEGGYKTKIKTLEEGLESKVTFYKKALKSLYSSCVDIICYKMEMTKI